MGLFKTSDELLEKGNDYLKLGEFSKALSNFKKANDKFKKEGDTQNTNLSNAFVKLLEIQQDDNNFEVYVAAAEALGLLGNMDIKFGIKNVIASELAKECSLNAERIKAKSSDTLKQVGMNYQTQLGSSVLLIPEIFSKKKITGTEIAQILFAISDEQSAEEIVLYDPKKAAEYYQNAANWRRQIGDKKQESEDTVKVNQYSEGAKCWMCGREIYGRNIHFLPMASDITPFQEEKESKSLLPSMDINSGSIFVCRACYHGISKKADEISLYYHTIAMDEIVRRTNELNERINELVRAINRL